MHEVEKEIGEKTAGANCFWNAAGTKIIELHDPALVVDEFGKLPRRDLRFGEAEFFTLVIKFDRLDAGAAPIVAGGRVLVTIGAALWAAVQVVKHLFVILFHGPQLADWGIRHF